MLAPSLGYWGAIVVAHSREGEEKKQGRKVIEANNDMICPNTMFVVAGASLNCILVV
jgi:hypothetical protein